MVLFKPVDEHGFFGQTMRSLVKRLASGRGYPVWKSGKLESEDRPGAML
jgi:hypothetical protein